MRAGEPVHIEREYCNQDSADEDGEVTTDNHSAYMDIDDGEGESEGDDQEYDIGGSDCSLCVYFLAAGI